MLTTHDLPRGPFLARALVDAGQSRRSLDDAVRDGLVRRVLRGVYVSTAVDDSVELRARAAQLVTGPYAVLVDRTAAWLHGVETLAWHETEVLPPVESFVLRGRRRCERAGVFSGERDLRDEDTMRCHGVVVTTPVRTALDLACALPERHGLACLDQFLHLGLTTRGDLERLLPRYRRRRGVVRARWLVAQADGRAESPRESWVRYEILRRGLPVPVLQHWVRIGGAKVYRLDLSYPKHRIVIEYDGKEHHTEPAQQVRDKKRRKVLENLGWIVIVLDSDSFAPAAPDVWIEEVRAALASRRSRTARADAANWRASV